MRITIPFMLFGATLLTGCDDKRQRAEREYEEENRRMMQEQQKQQNIEADRNLRAVETGVKALDILTR